MFFPIICQEENIIVVYGKLTEGITVYLYSQCIDLVRSSKYCACPHECPTVSLVIL